MTAIFLYAQNDSRGNPRSVYVVFDNKGTITATVDEKGLGPDALLAWAKANNADDLHQLTSPVPRFETSPLEYQRLKSWKKSEARVVRRGPQVVKKNVLRGARAS